MSADTPKDDAPQVKVIGEPRPLDWLRKRGPSYPDTHFPVQPSGMEKDKADSQKAKAAKAEPVRKKKD